MFGLKKNRLAESTPAQPLVFHHQISFLTPPNLFYTPPSGGGVQKIKTPPSGGVKVGGVQKK